jgi:hypothetical protein
MSIARRGYQTFTSKLTGQNQMPETDFQKRTDLPHDTSIALLTLARLKYYKHISDDEYLMILRGMNALSAYGIDLVVKP